MQENGPLFPGEFQGAFQLLDVGEHAEAALGVGVGEGIAVGGDGFGHGRAAAGGQLQQRFGRLLGQVLGQGEEAVFVGQAHVGQPLFGDAVAEQGVVAVPIKQQRFGRGCGDGDRLVNGNFFDAFADFYQLGRAGAGMALNFAPHGPIVGGIVVIHIAEQQAGGCFVDDESYVAADAGRPEVGIPGALNAVELQAGVRRVELEVESGRFHRFLLLGGQLLQTILKCTGNAKFHKRIVTRKVLRHVGRSLQFRKLMFYLPFFRSKASRISSSKISLYRVISPGLRRSRIFLFRVSYSIKSRPADSSFSVVSTE
jgi:hypothetical protein